MAISSANTGLRAGVCTSTTRPSSPYLGQLIFETDTFVLNFWNGSSWQGAVSAPAGTIEAFAGSTAPTGWLLCAGQAISRVTYANLFTIIGTTYGTGDGSTTFNIPDLRGRTVAGLDNIGGTDAGRLDWANTLGTVGGAQTHALSTSEMPSHSHTTESAFGGATSGSRLNNANAAGSGTSSFSYFSTSSTGSGAAHNNMQPTILLNYMIKF